MTPAINVAKKSKIPYTLHQYQHDTSSESFGLEAVDQLGVSAASVYKTLVVKLDSQALVVAIIPATMKLSMKNLAKAAGAKKAVMALPSEVERSSGYVLGGVSPLGQKKALASFIDTSAQHQTRIYVSGGRRGLEIELQPSDLCSLVKGQFYDLCL